VFVYAGIDEAGYGPLLGPLCVAASVFVLDSHDAATGAPNLWSKLACAVCRMPRDKRRRVAIDDSKKLKTPNDGPAHPLRHLERGVLSFASSMSETVAPLPPDDSSLFAQLGASVPHAPEAPWYDGNMPLPTAHERAELEIAGAMVRRALGRAGVRCALLRCETIDAGEFNRRYALSRNKAGVSFDSVVRLIDEIWARWPDAHPRIVVDRQGGREHYRGALAMCFPDAEIQILAETERVSRYVMHRAGRTAVVSFETECERAHLPTALASMTAKFVRELFMARFNRWFHERLPTVKPTAGYSLDGRRWLDEAQPSLRAMGIEHECLVRLA
jgi:ribonuclease HII